jgi:hypothetical protein
MWSTLNTFAPARLDLTINWTQRPADVSEEAMQIIMPVSQHSDNVA